jgi:hypothetical protein
MAEGSGGMIQAISSTVQIISVVVGIVISIWSFNATRVKEAEVRRLEAAKPFLVLRQEVYRDAVKTAAILANPDDYTAAELSAARKRFRQLYVAELSMVETEDVEALMYNLAAHIDPPLQNFTPAQAAAYELSHKLRHSFASSWEVKSR